jgi:ketosteroid isomerase-like protein
MVNAGEVLKNFYAAVEVKDIAAARRYLSDDLLFVGPFDTFNSADDYLAALGMLFQIVVRLDEKVIIAEGNDVAVFYEMETKAPVAATTMVAEWHQIKDGKINHIEAAFDARPFAAMFSGEQHA